MKYTVQIQQPASIVQEFNIEASSVGEAQEMVETMISNGTLPEPDYSATETCGRSEVTSVEQI